MNAPTTRTRILRDIATGPVAASVLRDQYGPYAYPCAWKLVADGLVEVDGRTKAYRITEAGLAMLKGTEADE